MRDLSWGFFGAIRRASRAGLEASIRGTSPATSATIVNKNNYRSYNTWYRVQSHDRIRAHGYKLEQQCAMRDPAPRAQRMRPGSSSVANSGRTSRLPMRRRSPRALFDTLIKHLLRGQQDYSASEFTSRASVRAEAVRRLLQSTEPQA